MLRVVRCLLIGVAAVGLATALAVGAADLEPSATKPAAKPADDPFAPPAWVKAATRPHPASRPSPRPVPKVDHVVIISIDGLRPDLLLRNDTPNLRRMYRAGAYTFWAKTTPNSITLPSHTSMLTGVNPRKHGIEWNRDLPLSRPIYPTVPTIFFWAKRYGYTTGMAAGKSKFDFLTADGTLDYESVPAKTGKDTDVARAAGKIIIAHDPDVMFVHLPGVDTAGHKDGWGSPQQCEAIEEADRAVGRVLDAVDEAGTAGRTAVIVSADHGGAGKSHGPDDARSRHIPWICYAPGVRKGLDLTTDADLEVRTEDTFATACWLLGIPLEKRVDGKPVAAAFKLAEAVELLKDAAPATGKSASGDAKQ